MNPNEADDSGSTFERGLLAFGYLLFAISFFLPAVGNEERKASGLVATGYSMWLCIPAVTQAPEAMRSSETGKEGLAPTGVYWGLVWLANLPMLSYLRTRLKTRKRRPIGNAAVLFCAACLAGAGHLTQDDAQFKISAGDYIRVGGIFLVGISAVIRFVLNRQARVVVGGSIVDADGST